jgi:hypothetical protein
LSSESKRILFDNLNLREFVQLVKNNDIIYPLNVFGRTYENKDYKGALFGFSFLPFS